MPVKEQESDAGSGQGRKENPGGPEAQGHGSQGEKQSYQSRHPGSQTIQTIGEVNSIGHGRHHKNQERNGQYPQIHPFMEEGDQHLTGPFRKIHLINSYASCQNQLTRQLLPGP